MHARIHYPLHNNIIALHKMSNFLVTVPKMCTLEVPIVSDKVHLLALNM